MNKPIKKYYPLIIIALIICVSYYLWFSWMFFNSSNQINNPFVLLLILAAISLTAAVLLFRRRSSPPVIRGLIYVFCLLCIANAVLFGFVRTAAGGFIDYTTDHIAKRYNLEKTLLVGSSMPADVSFVEDNDGSVDTLQDVPIFGHSKYAALQGHGRPGSIYAGKNVLVVYRTNVLIPFGPDLVYELEPSYRTEMRPEEQDPANPPKDSDWGQRKYPIIAKLSPIVDTAGTTS